MKPLLTQSAITATAALLAFHSYLATIHAQDQPVCSFDVGNPMPQVQCGSVNVTSTAYLFFQLNITNSTESDAFIATIKFDWDETSHITMGVYKVGEIIELNHTHVYKEKGVYSVGYKVDFGNSGGVCEMSGSGSLGLLRIGDDNCEWGITTEAPTISPSPTMGKTMLPSSSSSEGAMDALPLIVSTATLYLLSC